MRSSASAGACLRRLRPTAPEVISSSPSSRPVILPRWTSAALGWARASMTWVAAVANSLLSERYALLSASRGIWPPCYLQWSKNDHIQCGQVLMTPKCVSHTIWNKELVEKSVKSRVSRPGTTLTLGFISKLPVPIIWPIGYVVFQTLNLLLFKCSTRRPEPSSKSSAGNADKSLRMRSSGRRTSSSKTSSERRLSARIRWRKVEENVDASLLDMVESLRGPGVAAALLSPDSHHNSRRSSLYAQLVIHLVECRVCGPLVVTTGVGASDGKDGGGAPGLGNSFKTVPNLLWQSAEVVLSDIKILQVLKSANIRSTSFEIFDILANSSSGSCVSFAEARLSTERVGTGVNLDAMEGSFVCGNRVVSDQKVLQLRQFGHDINVVKRIETDINLPNRRSRLTSLPTFGNAEMPLKLMSKSTTVLSSQRKSGKSLIAAKVGRKTSQLVVGEFETDKIVQLVQVCMLHLLKPVVRNIKHSQSRCQTNACRQFPCFVASILDLAKVGAALNEILGDVKRQRDRDRSRSKLDHGLHDLGLLVCPCHCSQPSRACASGSPTAARHQLASRDDSKRTICSEDSHEVHGSRILISRNLALIVDFAERSNILIGFEGSMPGKPVKISLVTGVSRCHKADALRMASGLGALGSFLLNSALGSARLGPLKGILGPFSFQLGRLVSERAIQLMQVITRSNRERLALYAPGER
ncbi:hypothetical protein KCU73_g49, partial [Aureobasidium melanogenum]